MLKETKAEKTLNLRNTPMLNDAFLLPYFPVRYRSWLIFPIPVDRPLLQCFWLDCGRALPTRILIVQFMTLSISGAFLTAGVLTAGLISFKRGNSQLGQQLMRARVLVQGGTVALMVGSAYYYGDNFKRAG
ncbi:hypothetical protein KY285_009273 [Solanum tuberosum]|nr:hypothetical protein KY285_009273 [Solanum tuberosum]